MAVKGPIASLLLILVMQGPAAAVEIDNLDVTKEGSTYRVQMSFHTAAPVEHVVAVLTDFENPYRLNADVTEREVVSHDGDVTRVRTTLRSCFLIFCRDLDMLQDVSSNSNEVRAVIVPDQSDFRSGIWLWTVTAVDEDESRVTLEASMEPDVFVPPFFRKMLEREARAIATNLDSEASQPTP